MDNSDDKREPEGAELSNEIEDPTDAFVTWREVAAVVSDRSKKATAAMKRTIEPLYITLQRIMGGVFHTNDWGLD